MMNALRRLIPLALAMLVLIASDAYAIPAFARKYKAPCNTCHTVFPQLNRFGRDFRDNGFRMPDEVQPLLKSHASPPGTPQTSNASADFWSFIPEQIPFSVQAKLHYVIDPRMGPALADLEKVKYLAGIRNQFVEFMDQMRGQAGTEMEPGGRPVQA